ncbi:hypothetical protein F5X68DRAFT_68868 [Plectosphaerella plurivora]|uniref:Zn(2)-C6 fungal-type domain-containing protein n=1 Tax=Plectosphaerella plurivora TaxID=936078 RepID=A0A9P8VHE2_9PEZI|nr:hypothetical protein F5X68DRAFT_68868 [Plectosphaerella plurivora]
MSDPSHRPSRAMRAERTTTSCGECRRRKQKCDQRQPCGNCARRFPQPPCEYRVTKRRTSTPSPSALPIFDISQHLDQYIDQAIPGTYDALLDAPQPPWGKRTDGEVVRWSGIDLTTTYPGTSASLQWETGGGGRDAHRTGPSVGQSATCDRDCRLHSEAIHDALKLLVHHYSIPDRFLGQQTGGLWNPANVHDLLAWNVRPATGIPWPVGGPVDDLRHLPMTATRHNGELLRIYLKLLCRFKASLDGNPDSSSPYIRHYVPHCIQDPMLLQIILYTSSCFLNETGHAPRTVMMAHKGEAIRMLNEHLRSGPRQTSDSAIAGVVQLIVDEWYWGETQDLRAHLRGLREMIRLRGGFGQLGMSGFLAKNAITHDVAIALAHEAQPFLQNGPEFEFEDPVAVPFKIAHNTPFVRDLPSFSECGRSLGLHPATATMLDDMRFLFNAVLALPAEPTIQQLRKVQTTCQWVHNRLLALNPVSPGSRQASPGPQRSHATMAGTGAGTGGAGTGLGAGLGVNLNGLEGPGRLRRPSAPTLSRGPSTSPRPPSAGGSRRSSGPSHEQVTAWYDVGEDDGISNSSNHNTNTTSTGYFLGDHHEDAGGARPTGLSPSLERARTTSPGQGQGQGQVSGEQLERPDYMYQVVRHAALVYSRAIMTRTPIGSTCTTDEFLAIWTTTWRVPLTAWKGANGVFYWVMLAIAPSCHGTAHARFVKSMLMISALGLGLDNWAVAVEAASAGLRVQRWLSQGSAGSGTGAAEGVRGGGGARAGDGGGGGAGSGGDQGSGPEGSSTTSSISGQQGQQSATGGAEGSGAAAGAGATGGGEAVEEHGYHQPDW